MSEPAAFDGAPSPVLAANTPLAGGESSLSVPVPTTPALVGMAAHLQGAAVDVGLPPPIELTNALAVKLGP